MVLQGLVLYQKFRTDEVKTNYSGLTSTYIAGTFLYRSESIFSPFNFHTVSVRNALPMCFL